MAARYCCLCCLPGLRSSAGLEQQGHLLAQIQGSTGLSSGHRTAPIRSPRNSLQMVPSCWKEMEETSVTNPKPCCHITSEQSPQGAQRAASSPSTDLLKPGLMRDSPGTFLLPGKAEPEALLFLGLGSASVRNRQDTDYRLPRSSGCPASPSTARGSLREPSLAGSAATEGKKGPDLASSPKRSHGSTQPPVWKHRKACLPSEAGNAQPLT